MGIMVWSEIPVYWTIEWENPATLANARNQLSEMIARDKNRAAVVIWSVANETPLSNARLSFLKNLISHTRSLDGTRLHPHDPRGPYQLGAVVQPAGNVHVSRAGAPVLLDPAVYGGQREIDLAMMRLFGGFGARVFAAYEEAFPCAPGQLERVRLYQLYPLLVHLELFGAGYLGQVRACLDGYG